RRAGEKKKFKKRLKRREAIRPLPPSIFEGRVGDYFDHSYPPPFILVTYRGKKGEGSENPSPTHVDGTGRMQTVNREQNPSYWRLVSEFERLTGVPVVLNTSFNENEPVVRAPEEAIECFLRTRMDVLTIGNYLVEKV